MADVNVLSHHGMIVVRCSYFFFRGKNGVIDIQRQAFCGTSRGNEPYIRSLFRLFSLLHNEQNKSKQLTPQNGKKISSMEFLFYYFSFHLIKATLKRHTQNVRTNSLTP